MGDLFCSDTPALFLVFMASTLGIIVGGGFWGQGSEYGNVAKEYCGLVIFLSGFVGIVICSIIRCGQLKKRKVRKEDMVASNNDWLDGVIKAHRDCQEAENAGFEHDCGDPVLHKAACVASPGRDVVDFRAPPGPESETSSWEQHSNHGYEPDQPQSTDILEMSDHRTPGGWEQSKNTVHNPSVNDDDGNADLPRKSIYDIIGVAVKREDNNTEPPLSANYVNTGPNRLTTVTT